MNDATGVPPAVLTRLRLAIAGWRFLEGRWRRGRAEMSEELVDHLPPTTLAVLCDIDPASGLAVSAMN